MKIAILITNRSSYNKVKTIIRYFREDTDIEVHLVLGGSMRLYKYGNASADMYWDFPGIATHDIALAVEGDGLEKMSLTVGLGIIEATTILKELTPDAVLVIADRFEVLAMATAASYVNIPLIHLQGGEKTGSIDDKVRNAVTQLSDIHFPATKAAEKRIHKMKPDDHSNVYCFGCPSMDLLCDNEHIGNKDSKKGRYTTTDKLPRYLNNLLKLRGTGDRVNVCSYNYVIVLYHADTKDDNFLHNLKEFSEAIRRIEISKIVFWNNIDPGGEAIAKMWRMEVSRHRDFPIQFIRHIDPADFGALLLKSKGIIGNSSTGIREASFLGVPAVNIGNRQKGREHGKNVISVDCDAGSIVNAVERQFSVDGYPASSLYGDGMAGIKIGEKINELFK